MELVLTAETCRTDFLEVIRHSLYAVSGCCPVFVFSFWEFE